MKIHVINELECFCLGKMYAAAKCRLFYRSWSPLAPFIVIVKQLALVEVIHLRADA